MSSMHVTALGREPGEDFSALERRLRSIEQRVEGALGPVAQPGPKPDQLSLVAFSCDLDRLLATLTIATGAAAMGTEVSVFFTFWGTAALRKRKPEPTLRRLLEAAIGWMLPRGSRDLRLSKMNFGGAGTAMMRRRMASKGVADIDQLIAMAAECDVRFHVCEMSMDLLGMRMDELIDYPNLKLCGVSTFVSDALDSNTTLFV